MSTIARTVYVSPFPVGSDSDGNGTIRKPFASINRALQLRRNANWPMTSDQTISMSAGDYFGTVSIGPADSGKSGFNVNIVSADGPGVARQRGSRIVTGWTEISPDIYEATIPDQVFSVFENGGPRVARPARMPKGILDPAHPAAFAPYFMASTAVVGSATVLQYDPLDIDPSTWSVDGYLFTWSQVFAPQTDWFTERMHTTANDPVTHRLTLGNSGLKFFSATAGGGARYFALGQPEFVTGTGEFSCVPNGSGAFTLRYRGFAGPVPNQQITVPLSARVISMVGTDENTRVSHVQLLGLGIAESDFNDWYRFGIPLVDQSGPNDYGYQRQLPLARNGAVYMENCDHVKIDRCHIANAGFAGVFIREYGQQLEISNNLIEDIGTDGIYVEGREPGLGNILKGNVYWNNRIRRFGEFAGNGNAMWLNQSGNNVIGFGEFSIGPRHGLVLTGWDDTPAIDMYCVNNLVHHIYMHDLGNDSGDMGAITLEFFSRIGQQTVQQCRIDQVSAVASMIDAHPNGVFLDNQSGGVGPGEVGQILENVWVTNTQGAQLRLNDSPAPSHTLVNCSFLIDGSANPGFDPSLMDSDIGVLPTNPYA